MEIINTKNAPQAIGPYSQGIKANGFYFFSGQIALTPSGDFRDESIENQTLQIFKNIEALLLEANISKENIIKTTIFLADMNNFNQVNEIYANFFQEHKPARSTVEVSRLPKDAKVEIEITAID